MFMGLGNEHWMKNKGDEAQLYGYKFRGKFIYNKSRP